MRTYQPFSLPTHGAIEFLAGLVMMLVPAALSFAAVPLLVCVLLGAVLAGSSLSLTAQRTTSIHAHTAFDTAFPLVTALAALALAAAGQIGAVVLLATIVVVQAALGFTTRYVSAE